MGKEIWAVPCWYFFHGFAARINANFYRNNYREIWRNIYVNLCISLPCPICRNHATNYIKKGKWIAAMNRFKNVVEIYGQTIFVEEAIHRLVEVNYKLGLIEESQKYAKLLGYNYQSSEWYKKSYKVFNKNYESQNLKKIKKEKKGVISRFKKLFD